MSRSRPRRTLRLLCTLLAAATLIATLIATASAPAAAVTPSRVVHVTVSAVASATATATARVSAGSPAVTATARATARSSARATARVGVRVRAFTAHTASRTRARALKAAFTAAVRTARLRARARALLTARARALTLARQRATRLATNRATNLATGAAGAPGGTCGGVALAKGNGRPWVCTFDDEFDGTSLDRTKWSSAGTAETGLTAGGGCFVDAPDTIAVGGGVLSLSVRKEAAPFTCHSPKGDFTTQYAAGQLSTSGRFAQAYGRFAVRARFPATTIAGLQSSLWLWPQNAFAAGVSGEIDIAEEYSQYADRAIPYLHYPYDPRTTDVRAGVNVPTNVNCLVRDVNAFHEYAVEWSPGTMRILFDGRTCLLDHYVSFGKSPFDQPFFVALTQTLGIQTNAYQPARTPLPATMQVDWVRVWK